MGPQGNQDHELCVMTINVTILFGSKGEGRTQEKVNWIMSPQKAKVLVLQEHHLGEGHMIGWSGNSGIGTKYSDTQPSPFMKGPEVGS